jgi:phage terminase large subunit
VTANNTIDLGYTPRQQFIPFHTRKQRWSAIVAHRRAGKTVACIVDLIDAALRCQRPNPRFAYIAPTYAQAKDVAWQYLKDFASKLPNVEIKESELSVTFGHNGARIRLYGSNNYDSMRGIYLDGCVIDEYGDTDPRAWAEVIRPALSDRQGWAVFIGTPKGDNHFRHIVSEAEANPAWYHSVLRASKTGLIPPGELHDAQQQMSKEQYEQEYECSFAAGIIGSYYGSEVEAAEKDGRITFLPHNRNSDVYAAMDLGYSDSTSVIVFQKNRQGVVNFINHHEDSNKPLSVYADWMKGLPYNIDQLILPWDGDWTNRQTDKTDEAFFRERGFKVTVVPKHTKMDGINQVRLNFNRFWFDQAKCKRLLECLKNYRASYSHKNKVLSSEPLHDWTSHSADAMRYAIMGVPNNTHKGFVPPQRILKSVI